MTVWHGVAMLTALSFQGQKPSSSDIGLTTAACTPMVQQISPLQLSSPPRLSRTDTLTVFSCKNDLAQGTFVAAINGQLNTANLTPLPTQPGHPDQLAVDDECVVELTDTQRLKVTTRYWIFRFKVAGSDDEHAVFVDQLGNVDEDNKLPFHALRGY